MKDVIVATHAGTGVDIVDYVMSDNGHKLVVIDSRKAASKLDFDKLILLGGSDITPFWYGEAATHSWATSQERDIIEWTLIRRAMTDHKPILGICRGHQMIAVAHGGSLYQDILANTGRRHPNGVSHRLQDVKLPLRRHLPTLHVNSLHHQAIKSVPAGMQITALASDGIVESIWRPGVLGVQFHPELMIERDDRWERLFRWFTHDGLI